MRQFFRIITSTEVKPAGTYAKEILSRLLIDLSWNSSRLEGNTYSILETERQVRSLVTEIISKGFTREMAIVLINDKSLQLPSTDQAKFIEVVETTLLSLHEGNIARFWVTPAEFRKWKDVWDL